MEINNVSIIGLGALGILFGHHLSKKLPKEALNIIADKDRIEKYEREQIYCNGERCSFNYVLPEETGKPADLLIFAVKYRALTDAIKAAKNRVGENTVVISLLNGITSEGIIGREYGTDKVINCVAQGMDAVKEGNRLTYHNMGLLCIGDLKPGIISEKVKSVAEFFERTEIPYLTDTDMNKRLWGKFMLNVGLNQTVAVYGDNYGDIQKEGQKRDIMISAMREVIALSEKEGINLTEEDLKYWLKILGTLNPGGKPSMRQDVEAGRYSEVDLFAGAVLEIGRKYGVRMPANEMLYGKISEIESRYESK